MATNRVWTVPNALSITRLLLFGWFVYELYYGNDRMLAAVGLSLAGVTDYLDGYTARRFDQVSDIGRFLDPAVDRVMTIGALVSVMITHALPVWLGLLILLRESAVSIAALVVATRGLHQIQVSFLGKAGTFGLMWSLPMLVLGGGSGDVARGFEVTGWVLIVPSTVLAFLSAFGYLPKIRSTLRPVTNP